MCDIFNDLMAIILQVPMTLVLRLLFLKLQRVRNMSRIIFTHRTVLFSTFRVLIFL